MAESGNSFKPVPTFHLRTALATNPGGSTTNEKSSKETALPTNGGANSGALPDDLALIAQFWPMLSEQVKAMVLGIIHAALGNKLGG